MVHVYHPSTDPYDDKEALVGTLVGKASRGELAIESLELGNIRCMPHCRYSDERPATTTSKLLRCVTRAASGAMMVSPTRAAYSAV